MKIRILKGLVIFPAGQREPGAWYWATPDGQFWAWRGQELFFLTQESDQPWGNLKTVPGVNRCSLEEGAEHSLRIAAERSVGGIGDMET